MSQQPQGTGWWLASDGRWYPPQPQQAAPQVPYPPQQQYPPQFAPQQFAPGQQFPPGQQYGQPFPPGQQYPPQPPRSRGPKNRGCVIAAIVTLVVLLAGAAVAGYYVYRAVGTVSEVARGGSPFGEAECPTEQDVSTVVGSPVTLIVKGNVIVAQGCSYLAVDQEAGANVQITTGAALVADEQFQSVASDAATQGRTPEPISVGDRAEAFGGPGRSEAIAVTGNALILVEVFNAGSTDIGDKKQEAITLLEQMVAAR